MIRLRDYLSDSSENLTPEGVLAAAKTHNAARNAALNIPDLFSLFFNYCKTKTCRDTISLVCVEWKILSDVNTLHLRLKYTTDLEVVFERFQYIQTFTLSCNKYGCLAYMSNKALKNLKALESLFISGGNSVNSIKHLTALTLLSMDANSLITNYEIQDLTNITSLGIRCQSSITSIGHLTNLRILDLYANDSITNSGIEGLTGLTELDLSNNFKITSIRCLTNLCSLNLKENKLITDFEILSMTKLTWLNIVDCAVASIGHLINLTCLEAGGNDFISDDDISKLTNLTVLSCSNCRRIGEDGIQSLTKLVALKARDVFVSENTQRKLCHLKEIYCFNVNTQRSRNDKRPSYFQ